MRKTFGYLIILAFILSGCNGSGSSTVKSSSSILGTNSEISTVSIEPKSLPENTSTVTELSIDVKNNELDSEKTAEYSDINSTVNMLYENLYLGEFLNSGYIYIEPASVSRGVENERIEFQNYPPIIQFYPITNDKNCYTANFDSISNVYIPSIEENSKYYWQGFSEPDQFVLRYKSSSVTSNPIVGITLLNHKVTNIDYSVSGNPRLYSDSEYNKALEEVKKDDEDKEKHEGTLRPITVEDTIVGAKQLCIISIQDQNMKILLSKYFHVGFESTADVYVVDFILGGRVVQTFEKFNGVIY